MTKQRGTFRAITFSRATMGAVALFVLMGAKGEGCFNGGDPGEDDDSLYPEPPPTELCPPGHHLELICEDHPCDGDGPYPYPDEPPPDWEGQGEGEASSGWGPQPPSECEEICVPDEICPEGTYEEIICDGWGQGEPPEPMTTCLDPNGCQEPPPPPEPCYSICVPLDVCAPGEVEVWVCDGQGGQGGQGGQYGQGICLDPQGCQEPPPEPGDCYPICMPEDPMCPPGTQLDVVCDPYGCWEECVGYPEPGEPPPEPGMQP